MNQIEIRANFSGPEAAQEALHKLQALRAFEVNGLYESGWLTATVDANVVDRAVHLIEQIGGSTETIG
ncbi:hypothetical protein [Paenibacillus radicis (ex Gao et al. 2016)]|uniref:Uncharacterized protein n=1 Tax=Paenibacillus radicis (ex Gao et al. 2016) TaxID=1737354 RepID=A0A917LUG9_9BACL|nr:hypothetical protein [Paenibacillus radicis (ex Gao et al. 2016)]GGG56092.1 hypothetical protein GCM10010918_06280 [Paenibacillus radicis (ex Gao et al. 2016)]